MRASFVRGAEEDVQRLLRSFDLATRYQGAVGTENELLPFGFASFKRCWRRMSFGILLHACPPGIEFTDFVQEICSIALETMRVAKKRAFHVAALYLLYCLFKITPRSHPNALPYIRITRDIWELIVRRKALEADIDLLHKSDYCEVLHRLQTANAFTLSYYTGVVNRLSIPSEYKDIHVVEKKMSRAQPIYKPAHEKKDESAVPVSLPTVVRLYIMLLTTP